MTDHNQPNQKKSYLALVYVFFLSNFSLAVIYPIFTGLILKSRSFPFGSEAMPHKFLLLALLMSIFPLGVLFGWFSFRSLSKHFQIKPLFLLSLFLLFLNYYFLAISIKQGHYLLLLTLRATSGFFTGNIFICLIGLASLASKQDIQKNLFSFLNALSMIAFIVAILIGGIFSDSTIWMEFHSYTPFYICSGLYAIACLLVALCLKHPKSFLLAPTKESCKKLIASNSFQLLKDQTLTFYYICFFFLILAWFSTIQFLATDILIRFLKSKIFVISSLSLAGLFFILGRYASLKYLKKDPKNPVILKATLFLAAGLQIGCNATNQFYLFLLFFCFSIFFTSMSWSLLTDKIFSHLKDCDKKIAFYLIELFIFIAIFLSPLLVTLVGQTDIKSIYLINSASTIAAFALFSIKK